MQGRLSIQNLDLEGNNDLNLEAPTNGRVQPRAQDQETIQPDHPIKRRQGQTQGGATPSAGPTPQRPRTWPGSIPKTTWSIQQILRMS